MSDKEILSNLIAEGKTGEAIIHLRELTRYPRYLEWNDTIILISGQFKEIQKQERAGTSNFDDRNVALAKINKSLLDIIQDLPDETKGGNDIGLSSYHKHTCGRDEQTTHFYLTFDAATELKSHFFILLGGDLQSHEGMFKRIGYDLEGVLQNYINPSIKSSCRVLKLDITFDTSKNLDIYKKNVIKSLFAAASLNANEHNPLFEKDISYICHKSPSIQGLENNDFVCVLFTISQYDWDSKMTPIMVRWFINDFCNKKLPNDAPVFLFFFAIKYEEDNLELKTEIKKLLTTFNEITLLPELEMVDFTEVAKWFEKYKSIFNDTRDRKKNLQDLFNDPNYYMEDVENKLQQVIDNHNKTLLK